MMNLTIPNDWKNALADELKADYMQTLLARLEEQYSTNTIYPAASDVFNALALTSYADTKVVILGQDPYHGPAQAHGLSFSVQPGIKPPPSLKNIYKELLDDLGHPIPEHGYLERWAKEGVLLLNTVLTVEGGKPASHKDWGWERFTDAVIAALNNREQPVVFILWGKHAEQKAANIDTNKHTVIVSAHPSPFAARKGFFGSKPFSRANAALKQFGSTPVNWELPVKL
jgi:uracil-DNA glycosylase